MATTKPVSNSSTSNKSQGWISSGEHKLCNSQENSTGNHNSILLTIYISPYGPCYDFSIPTLMSMSCPHVLLLIHHASTSRLVCYIYVPWHHTLSSTLNLHRSCIHYVYTMRNHVSWCHSISKLFLILLDHSRPL